MILASAVLSQYTPVTDRQTTTTDAKYIHVNILRIDGSICHLKFFKVTPGYILSEVGTFCIVLLSASPGICLYQFFLLK